MEFRTHNHIYPSSVCLSLPAIPTCRDDYYSLILTQPVYPGQDPQELRHAKRMRENEHIFYRIGY